MRRRADDRALERALAVRADDDHLRADPLRQGDQPPAPGARPPARPAPRRRPPSARSPGQGAPPRSTSASLRSLTSPPSGETPYANAITSSAPSALASRPASRSAALAPSRPVVADDDLAGHQPPLALGGDLGPPSEERAAVRDPPESISTTPSTRKPIADHQRRPEPEPRVAGLGVLGLGQVDARLDEDRRRGSGRRASAPTPISRKLLTLRNSSRR